MERLKLNDQLGENTVLYRLDLGTHGLVYANHHPLVAGPVAVFGGGASAAGQFATDYHSKCVAVARFRLNALASSKRRHAKLVPICKYIG
jgi:hypothetical protein